MKTKFIPEIATSIVNLHLSLEDNICAFDLNTTLTKFGISSTHEQRQNLLSDLEKDEKIRFVTTVMKHGAPYRIYTSIVPRKQYPEVQSSRLYFYNETIPMSYLYRVFNSDGTNYRLDSVESDKPLSIKNVIVKSHSLSDISANKQELCIDVEYESTLKEKELLESCISCLIDDTEDFMLGNTTAKSAKRTTTLYAIPYAKTSGFKVKEGDSLKYYTAEFKIHKIYEKYIVIEIESHYEPMEMYLEDEPMSDRLHHGTFAEHLHIFETWKEIKERDLDIANFNLLRGVCITEGWLSRSEILELDKAEQLKQYEASLKRSPKVCTGGISVLSETYMKDDQSLLHVLSQFDGNMFVVFNKIRVADSTSPVIVVSNIEEPKHDRIKLFYRKTYGSHNLMEHISCRKISKVVSEIIAK